MKWFPFLILAVLAVLAQTTLVPYLAIRAVFPDLTFVLAVHYALWGPWPEAAIAAWIVGLIVDTHSQDPIGLHAFAYGAAAWAIIRLRQVLFRDHPITQVLITLLFTLGVQLLVGAYWRWRSPGVGWGEAWWTAFFTAIYTAAVAPYLYWMLARLGRWTGLRAGRRSPGYR